MILSIPLLLGPQMNPHWNGDQRRALFRGRMEVDPQLW